MWQDIAITIVQAVFAVALIPTILDSQKPAAWTSALNAGAMLVLAAAYWSLGLMWSFMMVLVVAVQWAILLVQRIKKSRS